MNKDIKENISAYISYFRRQVQSISDHCQNATDGELHSRILYVTLLDAIASPVTTPKTKNQEKFISFVSKFCDWPDCIRISLPHLSGLIDAKTDPELIRLVSFTIQNRTKWMRGDQILLLHDPEFAAVANIWPKKDNKLIEIDNVKLEMLQHSYLLYKYRNYLIHEFRMPGRHVELWDINEPYYGSLSEYKDDNSRNLAHSWELQYPAKFFRRLCDSGLSNLEEFLIANKIDPLGSIDWGNYWLKQLNKSE